MDVLRVYRYTSLCVATVERAYRTFACRVGPSLQYFNPDGVTGRSDGDEGTSHPPQQSIGGQPWPKATSARLRIHSGIARGLGAINRHP